MAPRANWKGRLILGEIACGVALYSASTTSDRIAFHTINAATGNRVRSEFVDAETGEPVDKEDEVKGYETDGGDHVLLEPEDIAAAVPDSDKSLKIEAFIACDDVDTLFLDRPYFLAAADSVSGEVFTLIRDGMRQQKVAALARTVLFRRLRTVMIRPHGSGLIANTLNFDYEVRAADEEFADIRDVEIKGEMLDLAKHIISTKMGEFDPEAFDDRYEAALADLVKAKLAGSPIPTRKAPPREKVVDLMAALRESAGKPASRRRKAPAKGGKPPPRKKAG